MPRFSHPESTNVARMVIASLPMRIECAVQVIAEERGHLIKAAGVLLIETRTLTKVGTSKTKATGKGRAKRRRA